LARRAHDFLPKKSRRRHAVRWHVGDKDKVTVNGIVCKCIKADTDGYIFQSIVDENVNFAFSRDEYEKLLDSQDFNLEPEGLSFEKAKAKLEAGVSSIKQLAARDQRVTDLREIAIWKFQELKDDGLTSFTRKTAETTIEKEIQPYVNEKALEMATDGVFISIKVPKAREFERWRKRYKRQGKLGLAPRRSRCGNRKLRYTEEYPLVVKHARRFLRAERPTDELVYDDLKVEIAKLNAKRRVDGQKDLRLPNIDYLRYHIARLSPFDVDAARNLDEHAKRRFHPSRGGIPNLVRPMQRVEVDDWETHLHVITTECELWEFVSPELQTIAEKTRCNLSVAICCVTRVLPAVVLSLGPHSVNIATMLRMCMTDKTPLAQSVGCETPYEYRGNPFELAGDEGTAILNAKTHGICEAAGVEYQCPQIETPQQRAKIERVFQTLEIRSLLRFSGRAFSNPTVRGKYEAAARACVTVAELAALILRFIVDQYHNTPHDGLDGETPRHCWLRLTKKMAPRSVPGKAHMRHVFGEPYKVTLQPAGIEIFGNWYTSPAVQKLFRDFPEREYTVFVDSEDLGGVSVMVEAGTIADKDGWLEVTGPDCMNGINVDVWDMAIAGLRRETKHIEKLVEPVVLRAISFASDADDATRKRLGIRWRLKTPEELEALRNSIGPAIRFAADKNPRPPGPVDMFSKRTPVGTKAPPRDLVPGSTSPVEDPKPAGKRAKPKPRRAAIKSTTDISGPKAARPWKPKERK
jgi:transposase InsO family protein